MDNGRIADYEFYASEDGDSWGSPVAKGRFDAGAGEQTVRFDKPCRGRFVRLVALSEAGGRPWASMSEFELVTAAHK